MNKLLYVKIICMIIVSPIVSLTSNNLSLRQHLLQGGKSYGPLLMSDSIIVAEILAVAGYGHIVIDHEHSPTDVRHGQNILRAIQAASLSSSSSSNQIQIPTYRKTEPIVRLPGPNDPVYMKKVLDTLRLPGGVLIPMVDDARTASAVVQSIRYPLGGIRGCAVPFIHATAYGSIHRDDYIQQCQNDLLVMIQVESPKGIEAIPDIAAIDGIDAIFLGPLDISTTIGKMGQYTDDEFLSLFQQAEKSILQSGCMLAGFRVPGTSIQSMFDRGYSLVCGSVDIGLLQEAARIDAKVGMDAIQ